jgi:hypothetical protein
MHYFFPGKTIGKICQKPIENRLEAMLLPYIDPKKFPELLEFAGTFVHRNCFRNWPFREKMSNAAFLLVKDGMVSTGSENLLQVLDQMLVIKTVDSIVFKDFQLMLDLEIGKEEGRKTALDWLECFQTHQLNKDSQVGKYFFSREEGGLKVSSFVDQEKVFEAIIPNERFDSWKQALENLLQPA